jgi:4,5-dihydroxyphthalate decarboxylase
VAPTPTDENDERTADAAPSDRSGGVTGTQLELTCALGISDLNRSLISGEVGVAGARTRILTLPSPERHWRMFRNGEFEIAEASMGAYLSIIARRPGEFVAIPAFPHRRFRHSYLFVAQDSQLTSPSELTGRRVALRTWTNSAGVWTRGILQDDYGLDLASVEWVLQDDDTAGTENLPERFRISRVPEGESVVDLVARGEVDALIYPEIPDVLGAPNGLRRLLPDARRTEEDYYRRTGIFPVMHTVVLRGDVVAANAWLPFETLRAFRRSKDDALAALKDPRRTALAWARDTYERQVEVMGPDPFAYDIEGSRTALETLIRYTVDQGILAEPLSVESLFHPTTTHEPPGYVRR